MAGVGRPSKFTEENRDLILHALLVFNVRADACAHAGIGSSTLRDWMQKGEIEEEAGGGDFADFRRAVMNADAHAEIDALKIVREAARGGDWHAAAWFLERRHPDKYGRKVRIEAEVKGHVEIEHRLRAERLELLEDPDVRELLDRKALDKERLALPAPPPDTGENGAPAQ